MYKYEELNDAKDSRPFPFPTNSIHKLHNELTDAAGCLANDRFTQGKNCKESDQIRAMPLEVLLIREHTWEFGGSMGI
ncbi:hypothetical protein VCHA35O135_150152 [Vibrio chagasii]|nr:hypothetical protein VCHA35O135_150152 [Vibrio chagasii]